MITNIKNRKQLFDTDADAIPTKLNCEIEEQFDAEMQ